MCAGARDRPETGNLSFGAWDPAGAHAVRIVIPTGYSPEVAAKRNTGPILPFRP